MTSQDDLEFCMNWVASRTGIELTPDDDMFVVAGIDSLDYAELLEDLSDHVGRDYEVGAVKDWASLRTVRGLVTGLFPHV
jgi:acyl carrier protein